MSFKTPCPACKEPVANSATKCPHCRTEFSPEQLAEMKGGRKASLIGCGVLALGFVIAVATCSGEEAADVPEKPTATAKADATDFFKRVMTVVRPCDNASNRLGEAATSGDAIAAYQAADAMSNACLTTSSEIKSIDLPTTVGSEAYQSLTDARTVCENAYANRWNSSEKMKEALDNAGSISKLAALKEAMESAQSGIVVCVASLMSTPMTLGATAAELGVERQ